MPLVPQEVSTETATDVLVDFIREHCRKQKVEAFARAAGYRTWFFAPAKKLRLFEEVFFLHAALALASIEKARTDRSTKLYLRTLFQYKVQQKIGALLGEDDPSFGARRAARTKSYSSLLASGGDEIGLASIFLGQLHASPEKSLNLQASMKLLPLLLAARNLIEQVAASMVVQPDDDAEPNSDF